MVQLLINVSLFALMFTLVMSYLCCSQASLPCVS